MSETWIGGAPPRDLAGYGRNPPAPTWPGEARIAINFVLNVEEGAERSIVNGDATSEARQSDLNGMVPQSGVRGLLVEQAYEYGSRVGFWRILDCLERRGIDWTAYCCGLALELNPDIAAALAASRCDIVDHGWRWIDYQFMEESAERAMMRHGKARLEALTGKPVAGYYAGLPSVNTRRLAQEAGYLYDSDAYNDDCPYWVRVNDAAHLVICHTLNMNDGRFAAGLDYSHADDYVRYLRDSFDVLYREGAGAAKMMTVAFHARLLGHPGRIAALERFLDYVESHERVWIASRAAIAEHWRRHHPPQP